MKRRSRKSANEVQDKNFMLQISGPEDFFEFDGSKSLDSSVDEFNSHDFKEEKKEGLNSFIKREKDLLSRKREEHEFKQKLKIIDEERLPKRKRAKSRSISSNNAKKPVFGALKRG